MDKLLCGKINIVCCCFVLCVRLRTKLPQLKRFWVADSWAGMHLTQRGRCCIMSVQKHLEHGSFDQTTISVRKLFSLCCLLFCLSMSCFYSSLALLCTVAWVAHTGCVTYFFFAPPTKDRFFPINAWFLNSFNFFHPLCERVETNRSTQHVVMHCIEASEYQ